MEILIIILLLQLIVIGVLIFKLYAENYTILDKILKFAKSEKYSLEVPKVVIDNNLNDQSINQVLIDFKKKNIVFDPSKRHIDE